MLFISVKKKKKTYVIHITQLIYIRFKMVLTSKVFFYYSVITLR